jgi:YD repeat-containing protein
VGNPVDAATGNKSQVFTELLGVGSYPLSYKVAYNFASGSPTIYQQYLNRTEIISDGNQANLFDLTLPSGFLIPFLNPGVWRTTGQSSVALAQVQFAGFRRLATVHQFDGAIKHFVDLGTTGIWNGVENARDQLKEVLTVDGSLSKWIFINGETLDVEVYGSDGRLKSSTKLNGLSHSFAYWESGNLKSVTDNFGRSITLTNSSSIWILKDPDNNEYKFSRDLVTQNLDSILYPNGDKKRLLHEDPRFPQALTGIMDESGRQYATWIYANDGRVSSSEHYDGVDKNTLLYYPVVSYDFYGTTTIVDALGTTKERTFNVIDGLPRVISQNQPSGSGCNASYSSIAYDTEANVTSRVDFSKRKTCYAYDTVANAQKNLETVRVEGFEGATTCPADLGAYVVPSNLAADKPQRKISTMWHPQWRLQARVAEPKLITTSVYNGQTDPVGGQVLSCTPADALLPDGSPIAVLCRRTEQPTTDATGSSGFAAVSDGAARVWNYTYNRWGQKLSEDGPRTDVADVSTWEYYADTSTVAGSEHTLGDLKSMSNPAGHKTDYLRYDKAGRLLKSLAANGVATEISYTPRGWVDIVTVTPAGGGIAQTTDHDYWPTGLLKQVTQPDGSWSRYLYDGAHRLTDVSDNLGNTVHYTLDGTGNRTKEEFKDPTSALARQIDRIYDALNRLRNSTGVGPS